MLSQIFLLLVIIFAKYFLDIPQDSTDIPQIFTHSVMPTHPHQANNHPPVKKVAF